ncbi:Flp family type IVb pilin [Novosphingobium sp.]|uniref:Flp family type IVb pilin n=1 Tax=Novosphingobium sp. TaxID=1874826 RepID=UPI0025FC66CB|nr:Flp family type IVb pilin [Novosphingobium sp.]
MTKFVRDFVRDETGAAAAEYALILAIVGAGIAAAAFLLGGNVSKAMTKAATTICTKQTNGGDVC